MSEVVDGIAACSEANGYVLGYPEDAIFRSEAEPYARSWLTHGLIDAGNAGCEDAFHLLRRHYDRFNRAEYLPQLLRRCAQGGQAMAANTRLYFTPAGKPTDIQVLQRYFQENYWLEDLAHRKADAIWQYPYDRPHCYLLTKLEAYLDLYRATGERRYLAAVDGAWDLTTRYWQNTGGSISIVETERCEPGSNKLYALLGETCGSAFWVLLNHRLHCLRPDQEKYVAEIEKSVYNVLLANQAPGGMRYHTWLVGRKEPARSINTCCEGQGTRIIGALAQFIYSITADGLMVNLYEASQIEWLHHGQLMGLRLHTGFPANTEVELEVLHGAGQPANLRIRIPYWTTGAVQLRVNGKLAAVGMPGTVVSLAGVWHAGDRISFALPRALRLTKYTGADQLNGRDRFALEYGPMLMAAIGAAEREILLPLANGRPEDLLPRLQPVAQHDCHFRLVGSTEAFGEQVSFMPYFEVQDQSFSCFPAIRSRTEILW